MHYRARHPAFQDLLHALRTQNTAEANKLMNRICSERWYASLRTATRPNTRPFFDYLTKAEVSKRWGCTPTDSVPHLPEGRVVISNWDKCAKIAEAFYGKLSPPDPPSQHGLHKERGEDAPLVSWHRGSPRPNTSCHRGHAGELLLFSYTAESKYPLPARRRGLITSLDLPTGN